MPPLQFDDLAPCRPAELTTEQMTNLRGGTSEPTQGPLPVGFCGRPPSTSPCPGFDPMQFPQLDPIQFPWDAEVPAGPAGPCGPSELIAR